MMKEKECFFKEALPVWEEGKACEKNNTLLFRTMIPKGEDALLRITGASLYQIFINGRLIGAGPARAAHGSYRVDELPLSNYLETEENVLVIQVSGYYINNFYTLEQPAFLCAEVFADYSCIAATGKTGFEVRTMKERIQKVQRYSYQRGFTEVYYWNEELEAFKHGKGMATEDLILEVQEDKKYLPRGIYYPLYEYEKVQKIAESGKVEICDEMVRTYADRSLCYIGESLRGYLQEELTVCSTDAICRQRYHVEQKNVPLDEVVLQDKEYVTYSFGKNLSGAVGFRVECKERTTLYMTFDEMQISGDYGFRILDMANVVIWELEPGIYELTTFEPYTMQYLRLASVGGQCTLSEVHMRRYGYPEIQKQLLTDRPKLKKVFDAAVETFRQNTFDIFMDCPSRERAGWLCDAFFMGRSEYALTGNNQVERNFLENYAMCYNSTVPEGMLPMCYPSDSEIKAEFIPQWGMWFVLELGDYYRRSKDDVLIQKAKTKVDELLQYFKKYENEYGLLECLDGVQMIEWSESKKYMDDVNFPTNMLYAKMLEDIGEMYQDEEALMKAEALKKQIFQMSFQDGFFVDNAIRKEDGSLEVTRNMSECCQYFAFFTGLADLNNCKDLWNVLVEDFGYQRRKHNNWENVVFANAFIGNVLRMDLLCKYNEKERLLHDMEEYFYYMAETTGTLWEFEAEKASCNHGFMSYLLYLLNEFGMIGGM